MPMEFAEIRTFTRPVANPRGNDVIIQLTHCDPTLIPSTQQLHEGIYPEQFPTATRVFLIGIRRFLVGNSKRMSR